MNDVMAYTLRRASRSARAAYSAGLVEALVHAGQIGRVERLHPDEDPLAARFRDQVEQFFVAQQVGADLCDPLQLRARRR